MNTYLIAFPNGVNSAGQKFQTLFNQVQRKADIMPNVYLVHSTTSASDWYGAVEGGVTGAPIVLPVDLTDLSGVRALPTTISTFVSQAKAA